MFVTGSTSDSDASHKDNHIIISELWAGSRGTDRPTGYAIVGETAVNECPGRKILTCRNMCPHNHLGIKSSN
jgi:hypothetical protein